jgi:hypothetical protein
LVAALVVKTFGVAELFGRGARRQNLWYCRARLAAALVVEIVDVAELGWPRR